MFVFLILIKKISVFTIFVKNFGLTYIYSLLYYNPNCKPWHGCCESRIYIFILLIYVVISMILELWKFFVFSTVNKTRSVMWPTKNFMLYLVYCFMNCIDFRNKVCCEKKNCFTIYDFSDSLVLSPNPNKKFIIHFSSFLRYRRLQTVDIRRWI